MEQKKPRLKNPILLGNFGLFFFFCQKLLLYSGSNKKNYVSQDTKWYITSWRTE